MSKSQQISRVNGPNVAPVAKERRASEGGDAGRGDPQTVSPERPSISAAASPGPAYLTEQQVKDLLHGLQEFRQKWAKFALSAVALIDDHWREAFVHRGAVLPEPFLRPYRDLIDRRHELLESIAKSTFQGSNGWSPPEEQSSLHDWEVSLEDLKRQIHDRDRRAQGERLHLLEVVDHMRRLTGAATECAAMRPLLDTLHTKFSNPLSVVTDADRDQCRDYEAVLRLVLHEAVLTIGDAERTDQQRGAMLSNAAYDTLSGRVQSTFGGSVVRAITVQRISCQPEQLNDLLLTLESLASGTPVRHTVVATTATLKLGHHDAPPAGHTSSTTAHVTMEPPVTLSQLAESAERLSVRAKQHWPNAPAASEAQPATESQTRALGFTNLATAIEMVGEIVAERGDDPRAFRQELHETLRLFAEAQNSVRVEQERSDPAGGELPEQRTAFKWLRHFTDERVEAFRIERYMRREDVAEPSENPAVARRLDAIRKRWLTDRRIETLRKQLAVHTRSVGATEGAAMIDSWKTIDAIVAELIKAGVRPSDRELRELILPIADSIPEELAEKHTDPDSDESGVSDELDQVLVEIQRFLHRTARTASADAAVEQSDEDTPDVREVRGLWSGQVLALVGGVAKPHAAARLAKAFDLKDVRWMTATKRDRVTNLAHQLRDVNLVVLITALMGHKHNDLRDECKAREIPFVQLKQQSGYGVNTVARAIVEQTR